MRSSTKHRPLDFTGVVMRAAGAMAPLVALGIPALGAQSRPALAAQVQPAIIAPAVATVQRPFAPGERLRYAVKLSAVGLRGHGAMWVDGPDTVRGTETWVLHFGFKARLGPVKVSDTTESWLDPRRMASLRFVKRERHPLSSHDEDVALFPEEKRWTAADGTSGDAITAAPLDELSFIYLLRTVPLATDSTYQFDRHFDAARNPTVVRVLRRENITVGAGTFATVLVEMRVHDPAHYRGDGVIRINLTDDERRLPVRIESTIPVAGTALLTLEALP
ncbi:MAG: DUF3108 domain-containing protein [Gemmatimonadaceae bacterium]